MNTSTRIRYASGPDISAKKTFRRYLVVVLVLSTTIFLTCPGYAGSKSPSEEMSDVVEVLCPTLAGMSDGLNPIQTDVLARCGEVKIRASEGQAGYDDLRDDQKNALSNMTSAETSSMNTISVEIPKTQVVTVLGRLEALRAGGAGGLSLAMNQQDATPVYYAGPITYLASNSDSGVGSIHSTGRLGFYINGSTGMGEKDATTNEPGFDYDAWGITVGSDYRITNNFVLGAAVGYSAIDTDLDDSAGEVDADGYAFSVYGQYTIDAFYVDAIGTMGRQKYDMTRNVNYVITQDATVVDQQFNGDPDADEYAFSVGAGYDFYTGGLTFGPFARLNYVKSEIDSYRETLEHDNTNPGYGLALDVDEQEIESLTSVLGGQASYAINTGVGVLSPFFRLAWQHEFENDERNITAGFVNVPDDPEVAALNRIVIPTDAPDRDFFNLGLGVSAVFAHGLQAWLSYATVLGLDDLTSHQFAGGVRYAF